MADRLTPEQRIVAFVLFVLVLLGVAGIVETIR